MTDIWLQGDAIGDVSNKTVGAVSLLLCLILLRSISLLPALFDCVSKCGPIVSVEFEKNVKVVQVPVRLGPASRETVDVTIQTPLVVAGTED